MKKVFVITQAKDADGAVGRLRKLGVLHVEHAQAPSGKTLADLHEDLNLINETLLILSALKSRAQARPVADWKFTCQHSLELHKRLSHLEEYSLNLSGLISEWQSWGDFSPEAINELAKKNIFIRLFRVPQKAIKVFPSDAIVKVLSSSAGMANCAVISRQPFEVPFKEISLPKLGLEKMKARLYEDRRLMALIQDNLQEQAAYLNDFKKIKQRLEKDLEFNKALSGMGQAGELKYLLGYIPVDAISNLESLAKKENLGIVIAEPEESDQVPTLIRNPRWISLIKPVLRLLGIVPGYHELDVSLPFLFFFSMFFGILIGDAGYGLVYLLLTILFRRRKGITLANAGIFRLFYVLGSCAIIWGVLTGTFFGQSWLRSLGLMPLVPRLNDPIAMQTVCFFIGALHLSLGHIWRALLKLPHLSALADIGWVCVLWSAFFLARLLILGQPFPDFAKTLLGVGIALVVFFTSPQQNILRTVGSGLGTLALSLMNNFTDVVSYVRLFAVGLAGVAIAETTNTMAAGMGNGALALIPAIAIVIIGHLLNLVLGPMSVLVHGVRLNVLEFSSHANITWSGEQYRPLQENSV
ncbi:MAG: V-type ATP synthase subunit I [Candidatus Omnitrophota bacterium]